MRRAFGATAVGLVLAPFLLGLVAAAGAPQMVPTAREKVSAIDYLLQAAALANLLGAGFQTPPSVHFVVGDAITFKATVTESKGTPKGTVSFSAPGAYSGACQSVRVIHQAASCDLQYMRPGSFAVNVRYSGSDKSHAFSSERITVSPEGGNITAQLESTVVGNPVTLGTDAYFSTKVSETSILDPGGTVEISSDGESCTASVLANPAAPAGADCQINYADPGLFGANYNVTATLHAANGVTATTSFPVFIQ